LAPIIGQSIIGATLAVNMEFLDNTAAEIDN